MNAHYLSWLESKSEKPAPAEPEDMGLEDMELEGLEDWEPEDQEEEVERPEPPREPVSIEFAKALRKRR